MVWWMMLILAALMLLSFVLYWYGGATVTTKMALKFVGNIKCATYRACTGKIRRIIRVKESGCVRFVLDSQLTRGEIAVELKDDRGETLWRLTPDSPEASADLTAGVRYRLTISLKSADGCFELRRSDETAA